MALGYMKYLLQSKHRQIVRDGIKTIFSHLLMEIVYRSTRFTKCRIFFSKTIHLLARSPEYPQRIRVASVFEPSACLIVLCLIVCLQIFSFFFSSSSSLQYCLLCYWPAPLSIHRGLEWPQLLNRLFDCSLLVCL